MTPRRRYILVSWLILPVGTFAWGIAGIKVWNGLIPMFFAWPIGMQILADRIKCECGAPIYADRPKLFGMRYLGWEDTFFVPRTCSVCGRPL